MINPDHNLISHRDFPASAYIGSRKLLFAGAKYWIGARYGSRRGFVRTQWHRILFFLGRYRKYQRIKWEGVERIVFVCKGNICRSPFAELLAKSRGMKSTSCGIDTVDGLPSNDKANEAAARRGQCLSLHKTQSVDSLAIQKGDLFVAMEPWHCAEIKRRFGDRAECTLLGLWRTPVSPYIHDPYGTVASYFDHCFDQIDKSVCRILNEIQKAKNNRNS